MKAIAAISSFLFLASCGSLQYVHTGDVPTCQTSEIRMYSEGKLLLPNGIPVHYVNQEIHRYSGDEFADYVKQCHMGLNAIRRNYTGVRDDLLQCGFRLANTDPTGIESIARERFTHPRGGYVLLYKYSRNRNEFICPIETGVQG